MTGEAPTYLHVCADGHTWTQQPDGGVSPSWGYGGTSVTWPGYDPATCPEPKRVNMPWLTPAYKCPTCGTLVHAGHCPGDGSLSDYYVGEHEPPKPVCLKPPVVTFAWVNYNPRRKNEPSGWIEVWREQLPVDGPYKQPADAIRAIESLAARADRHTVARSVALADLNRCLDAWIDVRVAAHQARGGPDAKVRAIDVPTYKRALHIVRQVEDLLEPWRQELGATEGRAFERVTTSEQLSLEAA